MKLKDKNLSPVGGWQYHYILERDGRKFPAQVFGSTYRNLLENVRKDLRSNGQEVPADIEEIVEDWICQRQPEGRCWYEKKLGDQIANVIHSTAGMIDKVAKTKLVSLAKGCSSCNKRRRILNNL